MVSVSRQWLLQGARAGPSAGRRLDMQGLPGELSLELFIHLRPGANTHWKERMSSGTDNITV
jgi:hypothetical protein